MTPITGVVITLNEERQIAECIRSLFRVCDEVIVVDSLSQDDTVRIAEAEGARVIGVDLNAEDMPDGVEPIIGDVTSAETIARAVAAAGEIHGLATIAGISRSGVAIDAIDVNTVTGEISVALFLY